MSLRRYLADSRAPRYSLLFAVPLLLAYELLAWSLGGGPGGVRNGADVLLKWLFQGLGGPRGLLVFNVLLASVAAWLVKGCRPVLCSPHCVSSGPTSRWLRRDSPPQRNGLTAPCLPT